MSDAGLTRETPRGPMMATTDIRTLDITPPHQVRDATKVASLTASMTEDGWTGRPLLVADTGTIRGLTGSHRTAAAAAAELDTVPCVVVSWEDVRRMGEWAADQGVACDESGIPYDQEGVAAALLGIGHAAGAALLVAEAEADLVEGA